MRLDLADLPSDPTLLQWLVRDMAEAVERRDPDQLALALEDLDADIGRVEERVPVVVEPARDVQPKRWALPAHLPREEVRIEPGMQVCDCCGGALHAVGESVSEMLDWIPA